MTDKKYFMIQILIGALIVWGMGSLTCAAGVPNFFSPYSWTVVVPLLLLQPDGAIILWNPLLWAGLPITFIYLLWSFIFIRSPYKISKVTIVLSLLLIGISICYNANAYPFGIKYHGQFHTLLMYAYNIFFYIILGITFIRNRKHPTFNNALLFNVLLFSWLAWVSIPWLGELL